MRDSGPGREDWGWVECFDLERQNTKYIDCMYAIIQYLLTFFISICMGKERKRQKVIEKNENDIPFSTKRNVSHQ